MKIKLTSFAFLAIVFVVLGGNAKATSVYVDWLSIDTVANTALGDLHGIQVGFSGTNIFGGSTTGTSTRFDFPMIFTPSENNTDSVQFISGQGSPNSYTVTFSPPVTDPVFHFQSLSSDIVFSAPAIPAKISGDLLFTAVGSTVTGVSTDSAPVLNQSNGSVLVSGLYNSITFTSELFIPGVDGITMQISAIPEPSTGIIALLAISVGGFVTRRQRKQTLIA